MPEHRLPTNNTLHYDIHGSGKQPMLMLHGLSQSRLTFKGMLPELTADKTLYLCDLPGHGDSYHPEEYRAEAMIADVASLLRDVIGEPTIVYGHSLGSLIATGLAATEPELVSKLILSDPPLIIWDAPRWKKSLISSYFGWARKTLKARLAADAIVPMLQAAFPQREMHVLQDQAEGLSKLDIAIIDATLNIEIAQKNEVLTLFNQVQCPTLLMQADPRILAAASDEDILELQGRIQQSQHVKLSGADHDLHLWKQNRVLEAVANFLNS